jgi:hypothetical protein
MRKLLLSTGLVVGFACTKPPAAPVVETRTVYSEPFSIDTLYASMQGPYQTLRVTLADTASHELLWVVGYEAAIVDAESKAPTSSEYMCHSNADLDMARHRQIFGWKKWPNRRLFTLSEGQSEVRLPEGVGVPMRADEPLLVTAQVLNHNHVGPPIHVRQRITVRFIRDRALRRPLTPVYQSSVSTLVHIEGPGGEYGTPPDVDAHDHHMAPEGMAADTIPFRDKAGRVFSGHWVVKPGRDVRHTPVNGWLDLDSDQTIRFVSVHLHPFAESIELRDSTANTTILSSHAENHAERIGLSQVQQIATPRGLPLRKDHRYELVSRYNNTSGVDRTAMAVLYLYLDDTEFRNPSRLR